MTDLRVDPPAIADEATTLRAFLDYHRETLRRKTAGLTSEQLATTLAPSAITLGGMLKHLAYVEDHWLGYVFLGRSNVEPWASADWGADADWEWHSAVDDSPEELLRLFDDAVAASGLITDEALADGELDQLSQREDRRAGSRLTLRWVLLHLLEEYARHNGHADLVRESIDATTGE